MVKSEGAMMPGWRYFYPLLAVQPAGFPKIMPHCESIPYDRALDLWWMSRIRRTRVYSVVCTNAVVVRPCDLRCKEEQRRAIDSLVEFQVVRLFVEKEREAKVVKRRIAKSQPTAQRREVRRRVQELQRSLREKKERKRRRVKKRKRGKRVHTTPVAEATRDEMG
jgi:hypothetical protein